MSNKNPYQNSKINRRKNRNKKRLKALSFFLLLPIIISISSFIIIGHIFSLILPFLLSVVICLNTIPAIFTAFNLKKPIWFKYLKIYGIHRRELSEEEINNIKRFNQGLNKNNSSQNWQTRNIIDRERRYYS
jgi:hypothetical protein